MPLKVEKKFKKLIKLEISRFILVGCSGVLIDLVTYLTLLFLGIETLIAKGLSFSTGAIFAYFFQGQFTFRSSIKGFNRFIFFMTLYLCSLLMNIFSNEIVLEKISSFIPYSIFVSFFIATSLSATMNFLGMKYFIFSNKYQEY